MSVFQVDCQLDGKPAVTRAFVHVDFHLDELVKYLCGLAKYGIVKSSPAFFTKLIDDKRLFLLKL